MDGRILDLGYLKCIDTGCGFGGLLTAFDVVGGQIWQADEAGRVVAPSTIRLVDSRIPSELIDGP